MKLNKKVELGINAVNALKNKEGAVRTQDLAVEIGTTQHFLEQIMRNLRTAGIVVSVRGPGGGYKLVPDPKLNAYTVAKAVGRDFGVMSLSDKPMDRLSKAVIEAFVNTPI
jgi:Rrf2 family protein